MSLARFNFSFASVAKFVSLNALGGVVSYYLMNARQKRTVNSKHLLVATGCDSGLGYSIALHCHNTLNMSVVACVHQLSSKGAGKLKDLTSNSNRFHMIELDVTKQDSVESVKKYVDNLLESNKELELSCIVNNAGVMVFGETEWQTNDQIAEQLNVNLAGTIRVTKAFLPLVRQNKSRIINITSHCGLRALPGLPIYCASKAGLKAFTDGLRIDMNKYGVDVVNFIPGSFVSSSNILSHQTKHASDMRAAFNAEQLSFYGDFFERYGKYLAGIPISKEPQMVDKLVIDYFEEALLDTPPKPLYICEPMRYKFYHLLFKMTPQKVTDWLLYRFVGMPEYVPPIKS